MNLIHSEGEIYEKIQVFSPQANVYFDGYAEVGNRKPRTVFIIQTKNLETNIAPSFLHFWVLDRHERGIIAMIPKD